MSTKEFYDKLEDQNLQIVSQMQQHQNELQKYFENMAKEALKLQFLIDKVKNVEPTDGTRESKDSRKSKTSITTTPEDVINANVAVMGYATVNSRNLMKNVQQLLNRLNEGRVEISDDMIEKTLYIINSDKQVQPKIQENDLLKIEHNQILDTWNKAQNELESALDLLNAEELNSLKDCKNQDERARILKKYKDMKNNLLKKNNENRENQLDVIKHELIKREVCNSSHNSR